MLQCVGVADTGGVWKCACVSCASVCVRESEKASKYARASEREK